MQDEALDTEPKGKRRSTFAEGRRKEEVTYTKEERDGKREELEIRNLQIWGKRATSITS